MRKTGMANSTLTVRESTRIPSWDATLRARTPPSIIKTAPNPATA